MTFSKFLVLTPVILAGLHLADAQIFSVYIGAPAGQTTTHGGAVTEPFTSFTPGSQNGTVVSTALATFTGTYDFTNSSGLAGQIRGADAFGGAGGTGQYVAMGQAWLPNGNPFSLGLGANEANYFGFWWSAGDANNFVSFYNNSVLLATFTSADIFTILSGSGTITSVNNDIYNKSAYFGNPTIPPFLGQNASEPYAYISIYAQGSTVFDEVRFDNGSGSTGFESDNHSLFNGILTPDGTSVFVTTIPEPTTVVLVGLSLACLLFLRRRRTA